MALDPARRRTGAGKTTTLNVLSSFIPVETLAPAKDELRVLKLVARDAGAFDRLLDALPATAVGERVGRIAVRCQTEFAPAYLRLVSRGYRVHWTDLRMTLESHPRRDPAQGAVMSNWEI